MNPKRRSSGGIMAQMIQFPRRAAERQSPTQQPARRKLTILVVEDHDSLQEMVSLYLGWHGYQVRNAASGEEALRILSQEKVHVILLDLMLPRLDGFDVLRTLNRENKQDAPPYIIVISAMDPDESRRKVLALGANEFMCKPFTLSALLEHIEELNSRLI